MQSFSLCIFSAVDFQNGLTAEMEKENLERYGSEPPDIEKCYESEPPADNLRKNLTIDSDIVKPDLLKDTPCDTNNQQSSLFRKPASGHTITLPSTAVEIHREPVSNNDGTSTMQLPQFVIPQVNIDCSGDGHLTQEDAGSNPVVEIPGVQQSESHSKDTIISLNVPNIVINDGGDNVNNSQQSDLTTLSISNEKRPPITPLLLATEEGGAKPQQLQERRSTPPLSTLTIPTMSVGYDEKHEIEGNEKPPLSPIPGSPSVYPSSPMVVIISFLFCSCNFLVQLFFVVLLIFKVGCMIGEKFF